MTSLVAGIPCSVLSLWQWMGSKAHGSLPEKLVRMQASALLSVFRCVLQCAHFLKEKKSYQGGNGDSASASALAALLEESIILVPGDSALSCGSRRTRHVAGAQICSRWSSYTHKNRPFKIGGSGMQNCNWASRVGGGFMVGQCGWALQVPCPSHLVLSVSIHVGDTWSLKDGYVLQQK